MSDAVRTAALSKTSALTRRVVDALAAGAEAVSEALRDFGIRPAPALRPIPVRASREAGARRR